MPTSSLTETPTTLSTGFELRAGGLGDLDFGSSPEAVIEAISGALGSPLADDAVEYAVEADPSSGNDSTTEGFSSRFGRRVCWPGFCAQFGGDDPSGLSFVGWDFFADPAEVTAQLASAEGVTVGSRWSDFVEAMIVQPGGCPTSGLGTTAGGIELALQGSEDGAGRFSALSESGEYVELLPDPSQVTVVGLRAGSLPISPEEDC